MKTTFIDIGLCANTTSVSYTHLDVYKRQDERMKQFLTDEDKLLALCVSDYNDSTEYDLFVRCLSEQTIEMCIRDSIDIDIRCPVVKLLQKFRSWFLDKTAVICSAKNHF